MAYARVLTVLIDRGAGGVSQAAHVDPAASLGEGISVGPGAVIGPDVTMGDHTVVEANAVLRGRVTIGSGCWIGPGAIIGHQGFGFAFEDEGASLRVPHFGGVRLGNRVEVGANAVVSCGTITDTVLGNDVKLNDLVHIAHNCSIGNRVIIAGGKVSGSVHVGDDAWIAPGATIRNKVRIGRNAFIGVGAVVVGDVGEGVTVVGNPARPFRKG